jgi:putative copper resistance protein D
MVTRLFSVLWLYLFTGLLVPAGSIASDEHASPHHHHEHSTAVQHEPKLPPSGLSPEEDLEYSRFMHHASGVAVLIIGLLLLLDRLSTHRYRLLRIGSGLTWVAMGVSLFVFSDLEAWPIGPAGFIESFSLPTADEWIQHHLLSMIPLMLGMYTTLSRWKESRSLWRYLTAGVAMFGGVALLIHQHLDHPDMDFVNIQHRFFALTSFFIAASLAVEGSARFTWKGKPYLLPAGLLLLGVQLALYVE